jgi:signal transduction histidine kinase
MRSRHQAVDGQEGGFSDFAWRAALIVLPVLLLAVFGGLSLRQDRRLVESEMRERSHAYAEQAAEHCYRLLVEPRRIGDEAAPVTLRITSGGRLESPPDYPAVPEPQVRDTSRLAEEQAVLWKQLESAPRQAEADRREAWRQFLSTALPEEFAALGHYRLGCLLAAEGQPEATNTLQTLIRDYPDSRGETGLPLITLATYRLAEVRLSLLAASGGGEGMPSVIDGLCSNAVTRPSVLTPWILERAAELADPDPAGAMMVAAWSARWQQDEVRRAEYGFAERVAGPQWPAIFWYPRSCHSADLACALTEADPAATSPAVLAIRLRTSEEGNMLYAIREFEGVDSHVKAASEAAALPDYAGVEFHVAGRVMTSSAGDFVTRDQEVQEKDGQHRGAVLGQAGRIMEDGTEAVRVIVSLLDPAGLYRRQRQRVFWFGTLIAVSAGVAFVGLASTWAAMRRQQTLYRMQSNFVSSVTHELRAPLGSLRLIAENFQRGKVREPGDQQRFFQYMVQECARLSAMIENVLGLARIEQGRQTYDFQETNVARLLEDTVRLMGESAEERRVSILLEIDRGQLEAARDEAIVDGPALQRAVINLLDNAIKHSPAGSRILVRAGRMEARERAKGTPGSAGTLTIEVVDQGRGIPDSEHAKIFERFYRRGSELRRESAGAGIGLSIVKHIVEAHYGTVRVESKPGEGSRFVLEVPWRPTIGHRFPLSRRTGEGRGEGHSGSGLGA